MRGISKYLKIFKKLQFCLQAPRALFFIVANYFDVHFLSLLLGIKELLLFARRTEIRGISLDINDTVDKITPITGTTNAIALDFHFQKEYVYWTDVGKDSISRVFLNGTGKEHIIPTGK